MSDKSLKGAKIVKRKDKWCVVGKGIKNFGCYDSKDEAKERLEQIYAFKHRKGEVIEILHSVSGDLYNDGIIHIADALTNCINSIIKEENKELIATKLGKIVTLLHKKGKILISEKIESLLPEVLTFEKVGCDVPEVNPTAKYRISAQRAYNITNIFKKKYLEGEIDESDFEYKKMKEFEHLLKSGFLFPKPNSYKEYPHEVPLSTPFILA